MEPFDLSMRIPFNFRICENNFKICFSLLSFISNDIQVNASKHFSPFTNIFIYKKIFKVYLYLLVFFRCATLFKELYFSFLKKLYDIYLSIQMN